MLAVARDEHAVALQTVNEPPPEEEGMAGGATSAASRGRRRPHRGSERATERPDGRAAECIPADEAGRAEKIATLAY